MKTEQEWEDEAFEWARQIYAAPDRQAAKVVRESMAPWSLAADAAIGEDALMAIVGRAADRAKAEFGKPKYVI